MTDLVLSVEEQRALRHLLVATPCPGMPVPSVHVLEWLAILVPADTVTAAFRDREGRAPQQVSVGRRAVTHVGQGRLEVEFGNGDDDVVRVTWLRDRTSFSERDRAMVRLVAPALARLVHERPAPTPACLTAQERAVLGRVAAGATNTRIAHDLGIAESTVRKHLEHTYRKLGVTGRLAAVARLQERDLPGLDLKERVARVD